MLSPAYCILVCASITTRRMNGSTSFQGNDACGIVIAVIVGALFVLPGSAIMDLVVNWLIHVLVPIVLVAVAETLKLII